MYHDSRAVVEAVSGSRGLTQGTAAAGRVGIRCPWPRLRRRFYLLLLTPRNGTAGRALSMGLLIAGLVMALAGVVVGADKPTGSPSPTVQQPSGEQPTPLDQPSVEMTFSTPKRFAIITELGRERQRLYAVGDSIADPADPGHTAKIQQIERKRVKLRDSHAQRALWIAEGDLVPGFPNRRFTRTAAVKGLNHRYVTTIAPLDPEPRLLSIQGDRAMLEVDIHLPQTTVAMAPRHGESSPGMPGTVQPSSQRPDLAPLERVRVKETAPHTYEISSAELRDALDHGGRLLAQEWPTIQPLLSIRDGIGLQVKSPVAEGILTPRGFRVTNPNLAGRAGIEVGDVILAINGQAVNSFADLFNLYLQAVRNPRLSDVEVKLERRGQSVTNSYRIR